MRYQPFDYQISDAFDLAAGAVDGLASDPGTGKTYTSLLGAEMLGAERILVVCPAVARPVWRRETEMMGIWNVQDVKTMLDSRPAPDVAGGPVVLIVGYEHLVASEPARALVFSAGQFDLMICDEAHMLKNPTSKRTRLVYGELMTVADVTWPMSGTFMLNHPGELWPHVNALDPDRIDRMNYFNFTRTFCEFKDKRVGRGRTVEMIAGARKDKAAELKQRLQGLFRRRQADVSSLPPLNFTRTPVPISDADRRLISRQFGDDSEDSIAIRAAMASNDPVQELKRMDGVHLSRLRTAMALAKVSSALSKVQDIVDNSADKVLVWCWHMPVFDKLVEGLPGAVHIRGSTTPKQRERAVDRFQNDPDTRVFIGQIQAAGTAITLTQATREIFVEQAFTPALNFQAAKRCVVEGQPILTPSGWVPVEQIRKGDPVITHTGAVREVEDTFSKGCLTPVCELQVTGWPDPICVTSDHKMLLATGDWVEAGKLSLGDTLAQPAAAQERGVTHLTCPDSVRQPALFRGDQGEQMNGNLRPAPDTIELTNEALFLLGYFAGDGFTTATETGAQGVLGFCCNTTTKLEVSDRALRWLADNGFNVSNPTVSGASVEVRCCQLEASRWFREMFGKDAHSKRLPEELLSLSREQSRIVLDGLMRADGHEKNGRAELTTASEALAAGCVRLIRNAGYAPSWRRGSLASGQHHIVGYSRQNQHTGRITRITQRYPVKQGGTRERVYDLTVPEDHSFCIGTFVAHNCHRIGQTRSVLVETLYVPDSIDEVIIGLLNGKLADINALEGAI